MYAAQYVSEFATLINKEVASVKVADRALSEAGLRQKASGRDYPDVKLSEGVGLLLAMMSGRPLAQAANAVRDLSRFNPMAGQDAECYRLLNILTGCAYSPQDYDKILLSDVIGKICRRVAAHSIGSDNIVDIRSHGGDFVEICVELADAQGVIAFTGAVDNHGYNHDFREIIIASAQILRWIGINTVEG